MTTNNKDNKPNRCVQFVYAQNNTLTNCSTVLPFDNTIPQNTEGTQIITCAITPVSASSTLEIIFTSYGAHGTGAGMGVALFQDSTANALSANYNASTTNSGTNFYFKHFMTSGTTSSTTFKIRVGANSGSCWILADAAGNAIWSGIQVSTLTIAEYL